MPENVPRRRDEKQRDYHSHARSQPRVHSGGGLDSLNIEPVKTTAKKIAQAQYATPGANT